MAELDGKVAFVTGASKGIGAATSRRLAQAGAHVFLAARSGVALEEIVTSIKDQGGQAEALVCDVSDFNSVSAAIGRCYRHQQALDILVNNTGTIDPIGRLINTDPMLWARGVDTNYKSVYFAAHQALPKMLKGGGGTIVNLSSGAANSPLEGWSQYCSAKAAVAMLTRCIDKEYRNLNIRCFGLSPGTVATDMQRSIKASGINPVSQLEFSAHITPEWAAEAVLWLCGPAADTYLGTDFSIKTPEGRALVGLV
jgi:3-oxoacyl-[acyl-carrier protein] reductase